MAGILRVTSTASEELHPIAVKLYLKIEGETFAIGNAALQKAKEIRELIAQLGAQSVPSNLLTVHNVRVSSQQGLLLKNQRAEFLLRLELQPEYLAVALGVIAHQKQTELQQLEWVYDVDEASLRLSAQAMQKAKRKAQAIAHAAETQVIGVHHASDTQTMPNTATDFLPQGIKSLARAKSAPLEIGMQYNSTEQLVVTLTVDFLLENINQNT